MNELLQKHGCSNVFTIPEGLKELMADISREVLRDQPPKIFDYIANYLSVLLITREHGVLAVKILDDLCDCRPSVSEHLLQMGVDRDKVDLLSQIIKEEVEGFEPVEGKEKVKEMQIMKKILTRTALDEEMAARVCQVTRNAYRDYWYRKNLIEKELKVHHDEPWEIAAERTLQLYKRTKPSYSELNRATQKIQAAYRGYHVRRNTLRHLKPKPKKQPKVELPGPPVDIACSREIDLGPVINLQVRDEDTTVMFHEVVSEKLHLDYDPMKTITHVDPDVVSRRKSLKSESQARRYSTKSVSSMKRLGPSEAEVQAANLKESASADLVLLDHRRSRANTESRPSRAISEHQAATTEASMLKISFAVKPELVIEEQEPEVPEDIPAAETDGPEAEADAADIPEDIPDDQTEGAESAPSDSIPLSAPDTANTTDVEDLGDDAATEE